MNDTNYANCIISDAGGDIMPAFPPGTKVTHLMKADSTRVKDFFPVDCFWIRTSQKGQTLLNVSTSRADRVIGLVGSDVHNPHDIGGELEVWVDGVKNSLKKSSLIFVPAGVTFGPVQAEHLDYPLLYTVISSNDGSAQDQPPRNPVLPGYTIVSETKAKTGNPVPQPNLKSVRILHMEDDMVQGSFYVDFVWLMGGFGQAPAPSHSHSWPELLAMAGCDLADPTDLGGVMSIELEGGVYPIHKSSLVCIPANVNHCPWKFLEIKKPIIIFTAGPCSTYASSNKDKW
jgi:hypothetical protein